MRRWNGWGDDAITYSVSERAAAFLARSIGPGVASRDASLSDVVAQVPASRLPPHPLLSGDPEERLRHACGQSFPDWIALRSGRIPAYPDGVAFPVTEPEIEELIRFAQRSHAWLIPFGGGTSVVGHVNPPVGDIPVVTLNMSRMGRLLRLDETSRLATFGAGVSGPDLEAQLRAKDYTLGHFPQSFEYSTLGGWIATRSSGQESLGYGRIEDLFAGGHMITPAGLFDLPAFPASAAGPDLRHLVLGSEGRLGVITEATVRVTTLPERRSFHAVFLPDWTLGLSATRQIAQAGLPMSLLRLSTPSETQTTLILAGHERMLRALERLLALRGAGEGKCMLLLGFTGSDALVKTGRGAALDIARQHGGIHVGRTFGDQWHQSRFRTPYLRNTLWDMGYGVDTSETATVWSNVPILLDAIEAALHQALHPYGERVHVFAHLSHVYSTGCSIYTTYLFRLASDPDELLHRWQTVKAAASAAVVTHGGTISHHHGVGIDHAPYLAAEKGELGMEVLRDVCRRFDPNGIMNPHKLL